MERPDPEKSQLTWTDLGGHNPARLRYLGLLFTGAVAIFAALAYLTHLQIVAPVLAATFACIFTITLYFREANKKFRQQDSSLTKLQYLMGSELVYAGVLAGLAMFMMFYFF